MKQRTAKLAILVLSMTGFLAQDCFAMDPIAISISGPTTTITQGSDVLIHVLLINTSTSDLYLPRKVNDSDAELNYLIKVTDAKGNAVKDTPYGEAMKSKQTIGSRMVLTLRPNESAMETALLNKLFILTAGGIYTVQAQRQYPENSGRWVTSNSIKVLLSK